MGKWVYSLMFISCFLAKHSLYAQYIEYKLFDNNNSPLTSVDNNIKIAIDSKNNIWVGSGKDLLRNKSAIWSSYNLSLAGYANITDLIFNKNDSLFISIAQGLGGPVLKRILCFSGTEFHDYTFPNILCDPMKLFVDSKNNVWTTLINYWPHQLFNDYLGKLSDGKWEMIKANALQDVVEFNENISVLKAPWGLYIHNGSIWKYIVPFHFSQNLLSASREGILAGGDSLFVIKDSTKIAVGEVNNFLKQEETSISCFHVEKDSIIWMGTNKGFILRYQQQALKIYDFLNTVYAPSKAVTDIEIDLFGNKWVGVKGIGIVQFNEGKIVSVKQKETETLPVNFILNQNYPNPFNPSTTISFSIPVETRHATSLQYITLKVYDVLGKEICTLVNEEKLQGNYEVKFNAKNLSSGIYYYKISFGKFVDVKKMLLLK